MKTILYGAFGRHNFGDLLFPHIVHKLIKKNIHESEIEFCDVVSGDMTEFGGHNVKTIANFIDYEDGVNVIHIGGEIGGCKLSGAVKMCEPLTNEQKTEVSKLKKYKMSLGYVLPKSLFKKPKTFIANSVGGLSRISAKYYTDFDYLSFRDENSCKKLNSKKINCNLVPDSAILTKYFFNDIISNRSSLDAIKTIHNKIGKEYIAVQIKKRYLTQIISFEKVLGKIISKTNLPILFFCAGVAPGHDSLDLYKEKFKNLPNDKVHFFNSLNIWDVCNVISNAKLVIGTSLHVRILSQQFFRPRVALDVKDKHRSFIAKWDNINNLDINLKTIASYVNEIIQNHDYEADEKQLKFLQTKYLEKASWVDLLNET
jgi:polysaccharide pyruvyl transferase WcaK-like protein